MCWTIQKKSHTFVLPITSKIYIFPLINIFWSPPNKKHQISELTFGYSYLRVSKFMANQVY